MIGQTPVVPVTFNTGQILIGLAAACASWEIEYRPAMRRLPTGWSNTQDEDGAWRKPSDAVRERG